MHLLQNNTNQTSKTTDLFSSFRNPSFLDYSFIMVSSELVLSILMIPEVKERKIAEKWGVVHVSRATNKVFVLIGISPVL